MVYADEAARRATRLLRKISHGVGVRSELTFLRADGIDIQPGTSGQLAGVEVPSAGYETVTPARHEVVAITIGDRECIVALRRDTGERGGGSAAGALRRNVRTSSKSHRRSGTGHNGAA